MAGAPAKAPPVRVARGPSLPAGRNSLLTQATALADAAVNPTISAIRGQIGQNNTQTTGAVNQVGGFYNQLGKQAGQGVTDETGIANDLNSQLKGIGSQEQGQLQGIGQDALASLAKYAPQSDASGSLSLPAKSALVTQIARQQGLGAQDQGAFRAFGANQGANYRGMAASNLGTFAKAGQESLGNVAQAGQVRNEPLENKLASAISTRGADVETAYGKLQQQGIANQIARAGLGIKSTAARAELANAQTNRINAGTRQRAVQITGQNDRANQGIRLQQINATLRGQTLSHQDRQAALAEKQAISNLKSGSGATKPLTSNENNTVWTDIGKVENAVRIWQQDGIKDSKGNVLNAHPTPAQMQQALGTKYNPSYIRAAFELMQFGVLTPQTASILHQMGIRGGSYNGKPIRVSGGQSIKKTTQQTLGAVKNTLNAIP